MRFQTPTGLELTLRLSARRMLGEIDEHVDATSSRLAKAQNRMDRFVREHSKPAFRSSLLSLATDTANSLALTDSGSNWCILILMVLLSILLFVILFM